MGFPARHHSRQNGPCLAVRPIRLKPRDGRDPHSGNVRIAASGARVRHAQSQEGRPLSKPPLATIGHRRPRIPRRLLSSRAASVSASAPRIAGARNRTTGKRCCAAAQRNLMLGAGCRAATTVAPLSISAPRSGSAATTCCAAVPRLGGSVPRPEAGGVQCDPVLRTVDGLGGTKARTDGTRSRPKRPILAVYPDVREETPPEGTATRGRPVSGPPRAFLSGAVYSSRPRSADSRGRLCL